MNKILLGMSSVVLILTIIIGIFTRQSFVDNVSQEPYIDNEDVNVMITHEYNDVYKDYMVKTISDIEDLSDIIVKVSVDNNDLRNYFCDMTISKVKVEYVYKGNINENKINIIEPIYYTPEGDFAMSTDGYYWMRSGNEYILFIDELNDIGIGDDNKIYIPTTSLFSKYNINNTDDLAENAEGYNIRYYIMYKEFWQDIVSKYD